MFVLGHSIPYEEQRELVKAFRQTSPGPIISLRRSIGKERVDGAGYHIEPDPELLLKLILDLVNTRKGEPR